MKQGLEDKNEQVDETLVLDNKNINNEKSKLNAKTRNIILRIAICALATALFVVLDTAVSIKLGNSFKITMNGFPIIIVAIMFGAIDGMIVGFVGAFLAQLLSYGLGPTTLLWVLPAVVRGLFVGLLGKNIDLKNNSTKFIIVIILSSIIVTLINTVVLCLDGLIYGYFEISIIGVKLIIRIISGILSAIVYCALTPLVIIPLRKIKF